MMLVLLLTGAIVTQWFIAPLGYSSGIVLVVYACLFITIALRQWPLLLWSLLSIVLLRLFSASNLVLAITAGVAGSIALGVFLRYVDAGQPILRTIVLCCVWSLWLISVLWAFGMTNIPTYVVTILGHILFIMAWSLSSSVKEIG
jgi:hypothetical protein